MHQVSNYLSDMNIQTVVYINIFLKITILITYFIAMHEYLCAVLILILICHIGICLGEVINDLQFNVLLLQHLIIHQFTVIDAMYIFWERFYVLIFIVIITFVVILIIIFNNTENKFNMILYLVTIVTTISFNVLLINLYVLIIVVIFNLILIENDIAVLDYIYDIKYKFKAVSHNNSGLVWNYNASLDKLVFLQQIILHYK